MKRGDIVSVAMPGDYGKPRPAVIIQANQLTKSACDTVLVCYLTSDVRDASIRRIAVSPSPANGLRKSSQIMVEKIFAIRRDKCGAVIGALEQSGMNSLDDALMFVAGLMDRS